MQALQTKVEFLQNENERIILQLVASRDEISRLRALVGAAALEPQLPVRSVPVAVNMVGWGDGGYGY
jgi:hypothetical protein